MYKIFAVLAVCAMGTVPAFAAVNNGCDKEDNSYINPIVALCSTHTYNVASNTNAGHNFSSDTDRQNQRDIIALKTTVITQQMKQQYDYLNSTIKRLKTQLQKAVLTTSLEAAGASSDGNSSSSYNKYSNIVLSGADDCMAKTGGTDNVAQCLQSNLVQIRAAVNANNLSDAMRQLKKDLDVADVNNIYQIPKEATLESDKACLNVTNNIKDRNILNTCINAFSAKINKYFNDKNETNSQLNALKGIFGNK